MWWTDHKADIAIPKAMLKTGGRKDRKKEFMNLKAACTAKCKVRQKGEEGNGDKLGKKCGRGKGG